MKTNQLELYKDLIVNYVANRVSMGDSHIARNEIVKRLHKDAGQKLNLGTALLQLEKLGLLVKTYINKKTVVYTTV